MAQGHNNPPQVIVELTQEQAKFVVANCDKNISFALGFIMENQDTKREILEKLINMMEEFKGIKAAVEKGYSHV